MTFEVGETYCSAVKGVKFRVRMKFKVQDTDCLLVYRVTPTGPIFARTSEYYPAIIETEPGAEGTATVLFDYGGFTTIYESDDDRDLRIIADIKKDPNWQDKCKDWDEFFKQEDRE